MLAEKPEAKKYNKLILIMGDQLSENISSLQYYDDNSLILMCEVVNECTTPKHHQKKIVFILSAMRHFAQSLKSKKYNLLYVTLDDPENSGSFITEIKRISNKFNCKNLYVTEPGEYRVLAALKELENLELNIVEDKRFFCTISEFREFHKDKKHYVMENFYRYMRKKYNILMVDKKPLGGKWNYDQENRKSVKSNLNIPAQDSYVADKITLEVKKLVEKHFGDHFGHIEPFFLATKRAEAIKIFKSFLLNRFPLFGTYQDAMLEGEDFMFHSHISFYLNNGLLEPKEVVAEAEAYGLQNNIPLNSIEGFIRQILGWREYVRGIYWLKMPFYKEENYLEAQNKLPDFFWHGQTELNCLKEAIRNTKKNSYAHHIQRLMILGNFALIAEIKPKELSEWYLIVYADAYEWVELPNVLGMVLFADQGFLATKPYASSGAYINKMSNYCKNCKYDVKLKNGANACPFNYLYWNFLLKNKHKLADNQRMKMIYAVLDKFSSAKKMAISDDSKEFLCKL